MAGNSQTYIDPRTNAPTIVRFGTPFSSFTTAVPITFSGSGDQTLVSAVALQTVRAYRILLTTAGATALTFKDGASTSLTGAMSFGTNGSLALDMQGEAWFTTTAGNAFILNSSNSVQVSGVLYYVQS